MLKISQARKPGQNFTLKLEGRIVGPWVNELHLLCESLPGNDGGLNLELSDVSYADARGVQLLVNLRSRGVALTGGSPFLMEQMKAMTTQPTSQVA